MKRLESRVAVITAAGSGMGRAGAVLFAREGAHVYVSDISLAAAEETVKMIRAEGGSASAHKVDVTKVDELRALFDVVRKEKGVLHVLWNHAGVPGAGGLNATEAEWDFALNANTKSGYFGMQFAHDLLKKAGGKGSVIFTSSTSGLVGSPLGVMYSAAKGGVVLLGKALALALAADGIRCNVICPGVVETPMLPTFFRGVPADQVEKLKGDFVKANFPMGRTCRPEEIATAALFLACDDSSYVTGITLPVDGGYTAR
jgi:NAD(P)-dependent dehydrogenase (short-subunit alcohol dehydrogenase family)